MKNIINYINEQLITESTRCNLIITSGDKKLYIYRHQDGYPSYTGKKLKEFISKDNSKNIDEFVKNLQAYDMQCEFDKNDQEIHGDIDYLYTFDFDTKKLNCYNVDQFDQTEEDIINKCKKEKL